jgi:hypothetical protein
MVGTALLRATSKAVRFDRAFAHPTKSVPYALNATSISSM